MDAPVNKLGGTDPTKHAAGSFPFATYAISQAIFLLIIFIKLYFDHFIGVLCLIWLLATVLRVNTHLCEGFRNRDFDISSWKSFVASFFSVLCAAYTLYVFRTEGLYRVLLLLPPSHSPISWTTAFWMTAVTDCIVKLFCAFFKNVFLLIPIIYVDAYKTGSVMVGLECLSALLRHVYAGVIWIFYFAEINWPTKSPLFYRIFFTALYAVFKLVSLVLWFRSWRKPLRCLFSKPPFTIQTNTEPTNSCVLCFQSCSQVGVLSCTHQLCGKCVSAWCNRHPFCPRCSKHICVDPTWRDGSMDMCLQLY